MNLQENTQSVIEIKDRVVEAYNLLKNKMIFRQYGITGNEKLKDLINKIFKFPSWYNGDKTISENIWIDGATSMLTARSGSCSAIYNEYIYVIGGGDTEYKKAKNEGYNTISNSWEDKSPLPTHRTDFISMQLSSKVYCMGGWTDTFSNINESYDILTDTWSTETSMPENCNACCASTIAPNNGNIYYFSKNRAFEYNPTTRTYTTKAALNKYHHTIQTVGDEIYAIGGRADGDTNSSRSIKKYNTTTNTWTEGTQLPTGVIKATSATKDNQIYVIGGNANNLNQCYTISTNAWTTKEAIPISIEDATSQRVDDNIFVFGGTGANSTSVKCYII